MEKFEVSILGCGSALPTVRHFPSAQVVNVRDKLFMVDCGEGAQLQLRKARLPVSRLHAIFISHLHGDHCFGLPGLISTSALMGRTADMHVYAPGELGRLMRPWMDYFCAGISFQVLFHPLDTRRQAVVYEDRSLTVETLPLNHRKPCAGFLFREKQSLPHIRRDMMDFLGIPFHAVPAIKAGEGWTTAEGKTYAHEKLVTPAAPARSYAYCSDTAYLPELAERVKGADLLFHEATFGEEAEERARETLHSTARQAAEVARAAGVKRLLIGHFSARYEDERPLLEEARAVFPETALAREGLRLTV